MRKLLIIGAMAAAAALAGCGAAGSTPTAATPTPSATAAATAAATPTPDLTAAAAQAYLAAASTLDAARNKTNSELKSMTTYASFVGPIKDFLAALQTFQQHLYGINFPGAVASQVSALVSAVQVEISDADGFIHVPDATEWNAFTSASAASSGPAAALRLALHLPAPTPTL
ncbi:MAG TPA: hypothetical protein VIP09_02615 [Dehalococcoidia bacterium]